MTFKDEAALNSVSGLYRQVRIIPKKPRAENRIREHGEIMVLRQLQEGIAFLVESVGDTWQGVKWSGWFKFEEASYEEVL